MVWKQFKKPKENLIQTKDTQVQMHLIEASLCSRSTAETHAAKCAVWNTLCSNHDGYGRNRSQYYVLVLLRTECSLRTHVCRMYIYTYILGCTTTHRGLGQQLALQSKNLSIKKSQYCVRAQPDVLFQPQLSQVKRLPPHPACPQLFIHCPPLGVTTLFHEPNNHMCGHSQIWLCQNDPV